MVETPQQEKLHNVSLEGLAAEVNLKAFKEVIGIFHTFLCIW